MNYFEFKQQLMKDSFTKDEEFHRLRKEDLRCAKAYEKAMLFEKTLKTAFEVKVPTNLKDSIVLRQTTAHAVQKSVRKYAIAATVFLSFVIAAAAWYIKQPSPVEQFIAKSVELEGNIPLSEQPISMQQVKNVFAEFQTTVGDDIGQVRFIHTCHTPGGTGVHMVISTDIGPVIVYYMPNTELDKQRVDFNINQAKAVLLALQKGSVAIIADSKEQLATIEPKLQNNLQFL
jgi:uncharacterized membrane protein YraQ (UPF0718 family)